MYNDEEALPVYVVVEEAGARWVWKIRKSSSIRVLTMTLGYAATRDQAMRDGTAALRAAVEGR